MSITLNHFRAISNGTHNVGQIMLDGDGLQKINNHVWQTGKNNVLSSPEDNRKVRQALYDAFENSSAFSEKKEMLNDIKTILLGGGNGSRSLSRDFVKQLFRTVDDPNTQGANLIDKMNFVSKSLGERKVSVVAKNNGLVTSSKGAAYEVYASEKMDIYASKGQAGFQAIKDIIDSTGPEHLAPQDKEPLYTAVKKIKESLCDMIMNDKRLAGVGIRRESGNPKDIANRIMKRLDEINVDQALFNRNCINESGYFVGQFGFSVEEAYSDLGLGFVDDHLSRIFPLGNEDSPQAGDFIDDNEINDMFKPQ